MDLAAIEEAALKAYQKDMNIQPPVSKSETTNEPTKAQAINENCSKGESTAACSVSYERTQAVMTCSHGWNIGKAPEGYYYYYNTETQVSQWESPSCLSSSPALQSTRDSKENNTASQDKQTNVKNESSESKATDTKKEEVKNSPYGQWTTVQTFEPPLSSEKSNSATDREATPIESVKTEEKFKERSTPKITFRSPGAGNEVAFKKRKLNPDKKRNVRQTDPNKTD